MSTQAHLALAERTACLSDELVALTIQLEEIRLLVQNDKGKYAANNPPDDRLACSVFSKDVQCRIKTLNDLKIAHSIAESVTADGPVIDRLLQEEELNRRDRRLAIQISRSNEPDAPPPYSEAEDNDNAREDSQLQIPPKDDIRDSQDVVENDDDEAGPSKSYLERQKESLDKLSSTSICVSCCDAVQAHKVARLLCNHVFCKTCLKQLFMHATKDEARFPPICCRQPISLDLVAQDMTSDELEAYKSAEIEFATKDRKYCSNLDCGKFIPPAHIEVDRAECQRCNAATCVHCTGPFHEGECKADTALEATLALAADQGWQRCHSCRAVVELNHGCHHIRCKCRAEFCYACGVAWKNCTCATWDERNLMLRAEEVVDREAGEPLPQRERDHRVIQMREELRENHECNHPGRFERVFGASKRGFRCEMCEGRHWKYILQCRHCHVRVCEDCRRHRVR